MALRFVYSSPRSPDPASRSGWLSPSPSPEHGQLLTTDLANSPPPVHVHSPYETRESPSQSTSTSPSLQPDSTTPHRFASPSVTNGASMESPTTLWYNSCIQRVEQSTRAGEASGSGTGAEASTSAANQLRNSKKITRDGAPLAAGVRLGHQSRNHNANASSMVNIRDPERGECMHLGGNQRSWEALHEFNALINRYADSLDIHIQHLGDCALREVCEGQMEFDCRHAYDVVQRNLFRVCRSMAPEIAHGGPRLFEVANPIVEPLDDEFPFDDMDRTPWRSWRFHYPQTYTSSLLRRVVCVCHNFPPYKLEVADYCISGGGARELLFQDRRGIRMHRADLMTLDLQNHVNPGTVNGFAGVLNYFWRKQRLTRLICFNTVEIHCNYPPSVDQIVNRWSLWLRGEVLKLRDAGHVYIPVSVDGEYVLVVVNFMEGKMQCIPTGSHQRDELCKYIGRMIRRAFWGLLQHKGESDMMTKFHLCVNEVLTPAWSMNQISNDQGICVMNVMERFTGSPYDLDRLMLQEVNKIQQLRVSYLCFMALSDLNMNRRTLLEGCRYFVQTKAAAAAR